MVDERKCVVLTFKSVNSNYSCFCKQTLEEEKERKSECLPPEPPLDDHESVKIVFKLPNNTRVERRFLFDQSLTVTTLHRIVFVKGRVKGSMTQPFLV